MSEQPRFKHHCTTCQFLGHFAQRDLYYCATGGIGEEPTLIARRSDEGWDYESGFSFGRDAHSTALTIAYNLAVQQRLIEETPEQAIRHIRAIVEQFHLHNHRAQAFRVPLGDTYVLVTEAPDSCTEVAIITNAQAGLVHAFAWNKAGPRVGSVHNRWELFVALTEFLQPFQLTKEA
jgi:hypothetical protein